MRASEVQSLRRKDLRLDWRVGLITGGEVVVPKSKTPAGTGRLIPLSRRTCACLTLWLPRFPKAGTDSFVFPFHRVGLAGDKREPVMWDVDMSRPMGTWRKAWLVALKQAGVHYRWHDLRHTFISRLAENANTSEQTIRGWPATSAARCWNATRIFAPKLSKQQFARWKIMHSNGFRMRPGTKMATILEMMIRKTTLSH
jgi:integrase